MSGDQTRRSSAAAPSPSMNESTRLIAKTRVPKKRTTALIHSMRSRLAAHQRHGRAAGAPSCPTSRGPLTTCSTDRVAAGAEEDAAGEEDRAAEGRVGAGLRQRRAEREQRAAENEGGGRDRVDPTQRRLAPARSASCPSGMSRPARGSRAIRRSPGRGRCACRCRPRRSRHLVLAQLEVEDSKFSRIRSGVADFGITTLPSWRCQRRIAWAGVLPWRSATATIAALVEQVALRRAGSRPRWRRRARRARRAARPAGSAGAARPG